MKTKKATTWWVLGIVSMTQLAWSQEGSLGGGGAEPAILGIRPPDASGRIWIDLRASPVSSWVLEVTSDLLSWSDLATVELDGEGTHLMPLSSLEKTFIRARLLMGGTEGIDRIEPNDPDGDPEPAEPMETGPVNIYTLFSDTVDIFEEGDFMVLRSTGVPDHPSPYFGHGHPLYEAYNGDNHGFGQNPNGISEQDLVFRVPKNPTVANRHEATPLGPIGIAINGVAFFNQYAGPNNQPLTNEINSFDQYGGHPARRDLYHYHIEPLFLSGQVGRDGFLGVLLDGFPVYGPEENGVEITNADLDEFHGHFGPTNEFPAGIYHYHFTDEDPYLNGSGYYGEKGRVTQ